jgi:tetratricopeptide (TPR) repeat protein
MQVHRHEHVYRDSHDRICHRIVWPRYHFPVYYSYGRHYAFRYVYPYYLRRYVFVSIGGYWPIGYTYARYYWYGCHPYWWYGYYPIAREVEGDTYNYYTYNYYYTGDGTTVTESCPAPGDIPPVDHTTFADVREKLAQQQAEQPTPPTLADTFFEDAVNAFEAGDYTVAIEKFTEAGKLAPDDMVLPFAYAQALFANEQYAEAAEVLRTALAKVSPEKEGVFYPRGLYPDDETLFEQIEHLSKQVKLYSLDGDLQLLLGYQLLGVGEVDAAVEPLQQARLDSRNTKAIRVLLDLVNRIKAEDSEAQNTD